MAIASCLVDTNILLRIARRSDPRHKNVDAALARLAEQRTILHYRDQNIAELWSVMTRPIPAMASAESPLNGSRSTCHRGRHDSAGGQRFGLPGMAKDGSEIQRFQVRVHDARLAAAMHVHGTSHILTLNVGDFSRFDGLTALHPDTV